MTPVASKFERQNPTMERRNSFPSGPSQLSQLSQPTHTSNSSTSAPHRPSSEQRQPLNRHSASPSASQPTPSEAIGELHRVQAASSHSGPGSTGNEVDGSSRQKKKSLCLSRLYHRLRRNPPGADSPSSFSSISPSLPLSLAPTPLFPGLTTLQPHSSEILRITSQTFASLTHLLHTTKQIVLPPPGSIPCQQFYAHLLIELIIQLNQKRAEAFHRPYLSSLLEGLGGFLFPENEPVGDPGLNSWVVRFTRAVLGRTTISKALSILYRRNQKDQEIGNLLASKMTERRSTKDIRPDDDEHDGNVISLRRNNLQDAEMAESPMMMMTPAQTSASTSYATIPSRSYARPVTRSMTNFGLDGQLDATTYTADTPISFGERLNKSSKKRTSNTSGSKLENSRDIQYVSQGSGDFEADEDEEEEAVDEVDDQDRNHQDRPLASLDPGPSSRTHPEIGQLRVASRRSARINDRKIAIESSTDITPAPAKKRARKASGSETGSIISVRRSPRFWKPPTEFHLYNNLPNELKMMIWEAAIEPRLLYVCNRSSYSHTPTILLPPFGVQNKIPTWFTACRLSVWIARLHYEKRFALYNFGNPAIDRTLIQDVNLHNDIVIFEPCHGACRGCHCARHQYSDDDRSAVRFLAIQTEAPMLPVGADPCWQTVTKSWPNVETLYLMRRAVRGVDRSEKAMIRVKTNEHEVTLLKQFEQWKKGPGSGVRVTKLEFVEVVAKENTTTDPKERYQSVTDRLTGLSEDIIIG
ncbi:uncharacterized protein F4822DRAFT_426643 [Hypoxylon trugodes]|uniref:uncharacterized protein n=1 Tax=Hypoxylon trugodes TaxID=326681 RepID=UPI0021910D2B|nr:uncharacterized protein F4822DRAFT_426643 [Hypoxylon trugodes]KAI1390798.1 hypothetical protein F4822DRAFT_426643 [Hypoxylon trugodes]